jgi:hypothetical protein
MVVRGLAEKAELALSDACDSALKLFQAAAFTAEQVASYWTDSVRRKFGRKAGGWV